jgi:transposase, IS30 family
MAGRRKVPREVEYRFWALIRAGGWLEESAAAVGVSALTGRRWFREAGGVAPKCAPPGRVRPRLCFAEREDIAAYRAGGWTVRAIAGELGRPPSTISRELRRGMVNPDRGYRASTAQSRADWDARRPKPARLAGNDRLRDWVQHRLEEEHSPEQISNRLKRVFPDDPEMRVSHESIYQALYVQGRGHLRRDLHKRLRTGRALRRPRHTPRQRREAIPNLVSISERPPEVADRAVPGHWEGDLIIGKNNKSAIGTLVERMTGFVQLLHLPDGYGADQVQHVMVQEMSRLPQTLRRTLAWDRGAEMLNHVQIAQATELAIYFCDPNAPWQRGSNENTNGLLRQYFPKGLDLSLFEHDYLDHVASKLNNRPRKRLDWKTPAEVLDELLSEPFDPTGVAPTA